MEIALTLLNQIIKMAIMMAFGYTLFKIKWLTSHTTKDLSTILLKVITPCVIVTSFMVEFSQEVLSGLIIAFGLSTVSLLLGVVVSKVAFKEKDMVNGFAVAFSNVGFLGIPLVSGLLGADYVIYLSLYIALFNVLLWSYGVWAMSKNKSAVSLQSMLLNPNMVALGVGLCIFIFKIEAPLIIKETLVSIGQTNTPLGMFVLGAYIAKDRLIDIIIEPKGYIVSFYRLIVTPLLTMFVLALVPNHFYEIKLVVLIGASTPCAIACAMFAQVYNKDYGYAAKIVSLSTILSIVTMPLMIVSATALWKMWA